MGTITVTFTKIGFSTGIDGKHYSCDNFPGEVIITEHEVQVQVHDENIKVYFRKEELKSIENINGTIVSW